MTALKNFNEHGCLKRFFFDAEVKSKKDTEQVKRIIRQEERALNFMNIIKNLSINNFPISLPESDEGSSQMRESQVS